MTRHCPRVLALATLLLAGCASTPAPVVNHSFGVGSHAPTPAVVSPPPVVTDSAQTYGIAGSGHANGTRTDAGYVVAPGDTLYSIAFASGEDYHALAARNGIATPYTIHPGQVLSLASAAGVAAANPAAKPQPAEPGFGPVETQSMGRDGVVAGAVAATATVGAAADLPPAPTTSSPVPVGPATPSAGASRNVAGIAWRWPASGKLIGAFKAASGGAGAGIDIAGSLGDPVRAAAPGTVVYSGNGLVGYGELIIVKHDDTYLSAYGHNSKRLVKEGERVSGGQQIALMGASGAPRVELHFEIRKNGQSVDPLAFLPKP